MNMNDFLDDMIDEDITPKHTSAIQPFLKSAVVEFLKKNATPTDDEVHSWAKENKFDIHKVEEIIYQIASTCLRKH